VTIKTGHVRTSSRLRADPSARSAAGGDLLVETGHGTWAVRAVINATGTWSAPNLPWYPGIDTFTGRQLHAAQYVSAAQFAGLHVVVAGGGISAVQLLEEISRVTTTTWVTRREPTWIEGPFTPETVGRASVALVEADARAGRPIASIVSYTGLALTSYARAAAERGALVRHPMFTAIEQAGVRMADGSFQPADVIGVGDRLPPGHRPPRTAAAAQRPRRHRHGRHRRRRRPAGSPDRLRPVPVDRRRQPRRPRRRDGGQQAAARRLSTRRGPSAGAALRASCCYLGRRETPGTGGPEGEPARRPQPGVMVIRDPYHRIGI
jgi:hypothetical protein